MIKSVLAILALAGLVLFTAQAQVGPAESVAGPAVGTAQTTIGWSELPRSFGTPARQARTPEWAGAEAAAAADIDVVDAHWMALTMWGEARGQGEEAMRAVGHVIDNRRRAGGRHGPFVTDTVSEAWQFSCWNPGDPNLAAIRNVGALPSGSREHLMWRAARRIADEILAGRSQDPTGGALFYHAEHVAPSWSSGLTPVARIGNHLFFLSARTR